MSSESSHGELSRQEKLLLARGAGLDAGQPKLDLLVSLAADSDPEVSAASKETLRRFPDSECAQWFSADRFHENVARFFLQADHFRPGLMRDLLQHPEVPQDAVARLAASAGPEIIPALLANLEYLRTPVLVALKSNPSYLEWQKRPAVESDAELDDERSPVTSRLRKAVREEAKLGHLVALAASPEEPVSRAARASLDALSDEECIAALTEEWLEEPVARYFLEPGRIRARLLPILLSHPDSPQDAIIWLASKAGPEVVPLLLDEIDLLRTPALSALKDNPTYLSWQKNPPPQGYVLEVDLLEMLIREMEMEAARSVEGAEEAQPLPIETTGDEKRDGIIRKIAKMNVAQRVKLALLGTREERSMLIRDPSRVVWRAVLTSPKLNEMDVEGFAAMKNVSHEILRYIAINRKFMKNYTILKNLASNPRLPIDIALPMLNRLLPNDLRAVSNSKDVPDTTRKMAQKLVKARTPGGGQHS